MAAAGPAPRGFSLTGARPFQYGAAANNTSSSTQRKQHWRRTALAPAAPPLAARAADARGGLALFPPPPPPRPHGKCSLRGGGRETTRPAMHRGRPPRAPGGPLALRRPGLRCPALSRPSSVRLVPRPGGVPALLFFLRESRPPHPELPLCLDVRLPARRRGPRPQRRASGGERGKTRGFSIRLHALGCLCAILNAHSW